MSPWSAARQWALFLLLTVLHILFNVQAVRALRLNALNRERVRILLRRFRWHRAAVVAAAGRTVTMTRGRQAGGEFRRTT